MKTIAIVGATGFIGTYMQSFFKEHGYEVLSLSRNHTQQSISELTQMLEGVDVLINLAGAPIIRRWNESYKKVLYDSRIHTTQKLVAAMSRLQTKPQLFFSTSAIGIYATEGSMSETHYLYANNFLSNVCKAWEAEAQKADTFTRVVIFRLGVVLDKHGGALAKMLPPFQLGIAGTIGDGSDSFSWIHIDDLLNAYVFAIHNKRVQGTYNLTSPYPVTNKILTKTLGKILHRPTLIPLPKCILTLLFSEGATVLTEGQCVIPERLLEEGFSFKYQNIDAALRQIILPK